jgi:hypothetical protein
MRGALHQSRYSIGSTASSARCSSQAGRELSLDPHKLREVRAFAAPALAIAVVCIMQCGAIGGRRRSRRIWLGQPSPYRCARRLIATAYWGKCAASAGPPLIP